MKKANDPMIKRNLALLNLAAILIAVSIGGCGYHIGASMMHPQIKSIAIAPVKNDTMEPNVSAEMRAMLSEQFCIDGSLKVKSLEKADCIIYCVVTKVETTSTQEDSTDNEMTYRPAEWTVQVTAQFTVIIPGRAKPLLATRTETGSAIYQVLADHDTSRRRGIQMACREAAEAIVVDTTEAW
jgi:outer membrane lipopolysaccharide assembly protein LptE/RlpB